MTISSSGRITSFPEPPKTEEPFSTPRSWHMLSDALKEYRAGEQDISQETLKMMAYACLLEQHAGMFLAYTKTLRNTHLLDDIIAQKAKWPDKPENRDVLYFLAQSFRARLLAELPEKQTGNFRRHAFLCVPRQGHDQRTRSHQFRNRPDDRRS